MNIYDKIKGPIERERKFIELWDKLSSNHRADANNLYNEVVDSPKSLSISERMQYEDNFFKYTVIPAANTLKQTLKYEHNEQNRNELFFKMYNFQDMNRMFNERSVEDIIERGRQIEAINPQVFDSINPLFWKYGDFDRKPIYEEHLQKNGIYLDNDTLCDWEDYRAIIEEFQTPETMGFHFDQYLQNDPKLKFYIDAGKDTYEFASLFAKECQNIGINPAYKVAIGNISSEINRLDKMCIYIDDLNQVPQYIGILEKIKEEKKDFQFEKPPLLSGAIDEWIGIGSDPLDNSSYNKEMCKIFENAFNKTRGFEYKPDKHYSPKESQGYNSPERYANPTPNRKPRSSFQGFDTYERNDNYTPNQPNRYVESTLPIEILVQLHLEN